MNRTVVTIYHQVGDSMFRPFDPETSKLVRAYDYTLAHEPTSEEVWRWNNAVDGNEYNVRNHSRSLSVGDVFTLATPEQVFYNSETKPPQAVDMLGFKEITREELHAAVRRGHETETEEV